MLKPALKTISRLVLRTGARIMLVFLVFAGIAGINLAVRSFPFHQVMFFLPFKEASKLEIHQLDIGFFMQVTIVPVILLYALTVIPNFRQILQDQTSPHATIGIFILLAAVQLISQIYEIWTWHSLGGLIYTGFLVIIIGSLLGGWRIGLSLGVISLLVQGSYELVASNQYVADIHGLGFWQFLGHFIKTIDWAAFFYDKFASPRVSAGVWVGVLACLCADQLGKQRFSPIAAAGLGAVMVFAAGYIRLAAGSPPPIINIPAQAVVTGLGAGAVMLVIRNLQVGAARRRAEAAELIRTQAELRSLRAQINPHFLFNALNTIRYTIRTDTESARRLLLNLSEVFQRTLRSGEFVSLRDEISYVEAYLSLEKARLNERLGVHWGGLLLPDNPLETKTDLLDQPIPTLTLQPLVENAVVHGIGGKSEGGAISITAEQNESDLVIKIEDNGIGIEPDQLAGLLQTKADDRACIGLCNVDRRLRLLYGEAYRLVIQSEPGQGTRVLVRIPITKNRASGR
jgi:signal transduction histidine kinase